MLRGLSARILSREEATHTCNLHERRSRLVTAVTFTSSLLSRLEDRSSPYSKKPNFIYNYIRGVTATLSRRALSLDYEFIGRLRIRGRTCLSRISVPPRAFHFSTTPRFSPRYQIRGVFARGARAAQQEPRSITSDLCCHRVRLINKLIDRHIYRECWRTDRPKASRA